MTERERVSIYVASKTKHAKLWQDLRSRGANIISTWIDEAGEGETSSFSELWNRIQLEVAGCNRLVFYVEPDDFPMKGALIEVGMALSLNKNVWVLGKGIIIDGRTARPLGSWIYHSMVFMELNVTPSQIETAVGLV